jgi:RNA polymerase sigma-70 factor (ECF subfamily)
VGAPATPPLEELADDFDVEVDLERHELVELLDRALALLPAETRAVLITRYVEEAPHAEIAARLGISDKAVSMRLSRGKLLLKELLSTELRDEAVGHGLIPAEQGGWQETRIWCLKCGQQRLLAHVPEPPGTISFRCPNCDPAPEAVGSSYRLANAHFAQLLGGLTRPRSILNRGAAWAHAYYGRALAERSVVCTNCGRPAAFYLARHTEMPALLRDPHLLYVECAACGEAVSQSFQGLVSTLPQVQAFWRRHPRLRMVRQQEIEATGQSALVTSFESVVDTARLDVVVAHDNLRLLSSHGTPNAERND